MAINWMSDQEFAAKVTEVAKVMDGLVLGQAVAVLQHAEKLLLSAHVVDTSSAMFDELTKAPE